MKEFLSMEGRYAVTREPLSEFTVWATGRVRSGPAFSQLAVLTSAETVEKVRMVNPGIIGIVKNQ